MDKYDEEVRGPYQIFRDLVKQGFTYEEIKQLLKQSSDPERWYGFLAIAKSL